MFWTQLLNKESRFALSQGELGGCGKGAVKGAGAWTEQRTGELQPLDAEAYRNVFE